MVPLPKNREGIPLLPSPCSTDKPHRKTPDSDSKPYAEWRPKVCSHQTCQTSTIIFSSCSLARARYSSRETIEKKSNGMVRLVSLGTAGLSDDLLHVLNLALAAGEGAELEKRS